MRRCIHVKRFSVFSTMSTTAVDDCTKAITKRCAERSTVTKKRRSTAKLVDPVDIVAVVVAGRRGNGRFVCPLCANTFGRRCEMKRHIVEVHTINGAGRFACKHPSCGKSFTRKDALAKHHIVKHQGKRRFVCGTCSEKFTSRYDLSRHNIRVHSNVKKRFTCEFCSAGFSQKSQLTMHKGRVHSAGGHIVRSSMDSLAAAAAMAMAAEEEAVERRKQREERKAQTITAEAFLEAARSMEHVPLTHADGEAREH